MEAEDVSVKSDVLSALRFGLFREAIAIPILFVTSIAGISTVEFTFKSGYRLHAHSVR
jgi:hypothetical protein